MPDQPDTRGGAAPPVPARRSRPPVTSRRRWLAVAVGLGALLVVAVPAGWTALLAYFSFSGCFFDCGPPDPGAGVLWSAVTVALLAMPVVAALATAGTRSRPVWVGSLGTVVSVVVGWGVLGHVAGTG